MNEKLKKSENLQAMIEAAVMLALSLALKTFTPFKLPFGGSVTLCSLLPICVLSYRRGLKWGFGTGFVFGLLSLLLGLDNLAYIAKSFSTLLIFVLFDYVLACMALGFGGVFRKVIKNQIVSLTLGSVVATVLRCLCYIVSGVTIWRDMAEYPTVTGAALVYSISYNVSYMLPEIIITAIGCVAVAGVINLRKKRL